MRNQLLSLLLTISIGLLASTVSFGQTCGEWMAFVQKNGYGRSYSSYASDAISKVTFYNVTVEYQTYYFAIVCFKHKNQFGCSEYIYQVGRQTEMNYSMNYLTSAGKAFWDYIQPYNSNLGCGPD